jgi:transposase
LTEDAFASELARLRAQNAALAAERDALRARAEKAEHERNEFRKLYQLVTFELERLKRQLFGKKAETVDPAQVQLAFGPVLAALEKARGGGLAEVEAVESELSKLRERAEAEVARRKAEKKPPTPHGRRDLSLEDLPVEEIILEPPERLIPGGEALVLVGEEVSEHIDRRPASLVRVRVVRRKYKVSADAAVAIAAAIAAAGETTARALAGREPLLPGSIIIGDLPERPIARGIAGPGLLAHVLVQKYADHLPLHRQERIFRREGLRLSRSTLCGFVQGSVALLRHIVEAMWEDARTHARWISIDATGVLVLAKEKCRRNHFWVAVAEREHVLFRFSKANDGLVPAELLKGFKGYVLADASAVYHELYRREAAITEVGCWAHARRKAFDALSSDEARALVLIGFIGLLYDAHLLATDPKTGVTDGARRKTDAAPVIDKLYAWIAAERPQVDDDAPIAKAMNYVVNHKTHLTRFLEDGLLRLDNNLAEAELRREKVGANNWLYCGSDDGAHWNSVVVSLVASCQLHGIEPWAYLRDVLTLLPAWPVNRALELSPKLWNETCQKPETQQLLGSLRLLGRNDPSHAADSTPPA